MMKETVVGEHSQTSVGFISIPVGTTAKGDSYYMQYGMCRFGNLCPVIASAKMPLLIACA